MSARPARRALLALSLAALAGRAGAANPDTYTVGNVPVAAGAAQLEFPVRGAFRADVGLAVMCQGTYDDRSPFEYLSLVAPAASLHYDGVRNLRLTAAFQEFLYREVPPLRIPDGHEERLVVRARIQQPRGEAALYELLQLDVRRFEDAAGVDRLVFRPRFRLGQGFNLDAVRIHSLVLYQEVAFRFSEQGYAARAFEFFRAFAGYTWTTRRGTFLTLGLLGQVSLNPAATRYDVLWGPVITAAYRLRAPAAAAPAPPSEVEVQ